MTYDSDKRLFLPFLILLLAFGVAGGCSNPDDDDDSAQDDDDSAADDDDSTENDTVDATTFSGEMNVTPQTGDDDDSSGDDDDSAGDDDDSAGDDDDSAGDDDDSAAGDDDDSASTGERGAPSAGGIVTGSFVVRYWENLDAQLLYCQQTVTWEGTVDWGFGVLSPDCDTCSGTVSISSESIVDVSDPNANADDCDVAALAANEINNFGDLMTGEDGGFAWLEMPLLDLATAEGIGLDPTDGGTLQDTVEGLASNGLELTHIGFVDVTDATVFGPSNLNLAAAGANPPEDGAPFGAFWTVFKDPNANTHPADIDLNGDYFLGSFWLLQ